MKTQNVLKFLAASTPLEYPAGGVQSLFTFGDSYTTTGFNASSTQPSPGNPMGNPALGDGTAADSVNWVGYLTTVYNDTPVLNYNLAVYGATVNNSLIPNVPGDLVYQVEEIFETHYCRPAPGSDPLWTADSALFAIWIGINDIYFSSLDTDPSGSLEAIMQPYFELVDQLHGCGARHFLVINSPPLDRSPELLDSERSMRELYKALVEQFNCQLGDAAAVWASGHPDSTISLYNASRFMSDVLDHPAEFGFLDASCVGEGCVWWDRFHPRSAFHRLLAEDVALHLRGEVGV
ncbi:hypothetical protein BJX99DRAFT_267401 [Aspergillus californicus]